MKSGVSSGVSADEPASPVSANMVIVMLHLQYKARIYPDINLNVSCTNRHSVRDTVNASMHSVDE